jgi:5-methylcytosine-specific restriction endonuclease McrA
VACKLEGYFTAAVEVDHVIPLHKGGKDDASNLQSLCRDCHDAKTRRDLGQRDRSHAIGVDGWPVNGGTAAAGGQ